MTSIINIEKTRYSDLLRPVGTSITFVLCVCLNACGSSTTSNTVDPELEVVDPTNNATNPLDNTAWLLTTVQLNDGSTITVAEQDPGFTFSLQFTGDSTTEISDGIASGSLDCNGFSASYLFSDSILTLDDVLVTDAECDSLSSVGGIVFRIIVQPPVTAEVNPDTLILTSMRNESLIYVPLDMVDDF